MYHAIHLKNNTLTTQTSDYIKKHDLVYLTPTYKGYEGLPLGNGNLGGMLFHTPSSIEFVFNQTDAIDFAPDGNFKAWAWESEETHTNPVSCGKLSITDTLPSFDWMYLNQFEERLSLSDATASLHSETPFSSYKLKTFILEEPSVSVFEVTSETCEEVERKITFEKWSSPAFFHYYEQILKSPEKNLRNVEVGSIQDCLYIRQQLGGTDVLLCAKILCDSFQIHKVNAHTIEFILPASSSHTFTVLTTVVTCHDGLASTQLALDRLEKATLELSLLHQNHLKSWHDFWNKSFVHLSEDDYLENVYYMHLYQLNACSRGKYPITFAGLWNTFRDSRNWGHFYHWNHQQTYWGLHAANHPELITNYYTYRFNMLPHAKADAKTYHNSTGAYFSDISNLNGYQALEPDTLRNLSVGAQISLEFYKHYQYTGDLDFLTTQALPFMQACMQLYCDLLTQDPLGRYFIRGGSTPYESYWNLKTTTTDYAMIKSLGYALLDLQDIIPLPEELGQKYTDILYNLFELPLTTEDDATLLSCGTKWNNDSVAFHEGEYPLSPFPGCELASVYPANLIGLSTPSELFDIAYTTAKRIIDTEVYTAGPKGCSGHTPLPQVAARLGMREDTLPVLREYVNKYQVFCNGLAHFADIRSNQFWEPHFTPRVLSENTATTDWHAMHEKKLGKRTSISSDYFLHNYFEPTSNILTGIHEMLLQSYDGIIRIFPAVPDDYTTLFTLLSTGGFLVTSEKQGTDIRYIQILSQKGGRCLIHNPWDTTALSVTTDNTPAPYELQNNIIAFDTHPDTVYTLVRCEYPLEVFYINELQVTSPTEPKTFNKNIIGKHSIY